MKCLPILLLVTSAFLLTHCDTSKKVSTAPIKADFVIENVKLFDGVAVRENCNVAVKDEKVVAIWSKRKNVKSKEIIDGTGKTLIPGLINAHVHAWFPNHLKEAAEAGVMAVFDLHSSGFSMLTLTQFRDTIGWANYYYAGPGATVPRGHGTQFGMSVPEIGNNLTPAQYIKDRISENVDFIKILREPSLPTISFEQIDTVLQIAKKNNLVAVSHISRRDDALQVAQLGADGLAHIWWDKAITPAQIDSLKQTNAFVTPTMMVVEKALEMGRKQGWAKDYLKFDDIINEVQQLHEAGIVLLAGTDPPNLGLNHGTDLYKELYYMVEAGLTPLEALRTATGNTSKAFQIKEIGWIKVGNRASFSLIDGDPTSNINDLEKMEMVWQKGARLK